MTALRLILGFVAALADAPSQPPPSEVLQFVGDVLQVLQSFGVVPLWGVVVGAILAAVVAVAFQRLGLFALLGKAWTYLRTLPAPDPHPEDEPRLPPMPNPPPTRQDGDP